MAVSTAQESSWRHILTEPLESHTTPLLMRVFLECVFVHIGVGWGGGNNIITRLLNRMIL